MNCNSGGGFFKIADPDTNKQFLLSSSKVKK